MKRKYYQITEADNRASIDIYGDITSWPWLDSDVSAYDIKKEIDALDVSDIDVFINSYGGEVAEALAIYSALKRNSAAVHTYCDGFACSAASIVFAAGDTRTMGEIGLLMIHNCMSYIGYANSEELRKAAEDNDKINQSSINAYKAATGLEEDKIRELMDAETWITAQEAVELGFATDIAGAEEDEKPEQSAFSVIRSRLLASGDSDPEKNSVLIDIDALAEKISGNLLQKMLEPENSGAVPEDGEPVDPEDPEDIEDPKDPDVPEENAAINSFLNIFA